MRRNKWLRRGAFFLIFLLVLYGGFCWALFNPLESDVENLIAFLPRDVTYLIHSPWGNLRDSTFYRKNVLDSAVREDVEGAFELEEYLYRPIREVEEQVNASLPSFAGKFSILDDVVGRELIVAGQLTGPGETISDKIMNSPFVVLTRISTKAKFMEALNYSFVQSQVPNLKTYRDYFEYDVGAENVREGAPETARLFYFKRIRDVLVLSNDDDLMKRVVHFGLASGEDQQGKLSLPRYWWFYYDFNKGEMPQEPGVSAWVRLNQADRDLSGLLEGRGEVRQGGFGDFLRNLFPVALTNTISLNLAAGNEQTIPIRGSVRMVERESFPERILGFHQREGADVAEAVAGSAGMIPADRTFIFQWIKMAPRHFLSCFFSSLDQGSRDMLFGADSGPGGSGGNWNLERTADELGVWFEDGVTIAVSRLPEADTLDLDTFEGSMLPLPGTTLILKERPHLTEDELIQFFVRNHERFGFEMPTRSDGEHGTVYQMPLTVDMTLGLLKPAFAVKNGRFLFSTNVGELRRIMAVADGQGESLNDSDRFVEALDQAWPEGNLFTFLDIEELRPYLKDQRWEHAFNATNFNRPEFRRRTVIELNNEHPTWDTRKLSEEAGSLMDQREDRRKEVDFPRAIRAYLDKLYWVEAFDWLAISTDVSVDQAGPVLKLWGAPRVTPADEAE
jgi:hypothetical protein